MAIEKLDLASEALGVGPVVGVHARGQVALRPFESDTYLVIQRFNVVLKGPFDLGLEYRVLAQREADDRRQGWLTEFSWRVKRSLRLGVGYNFTDFSDNEFSQNDYSVGGVFLRIQGLY